MKKITSALLAIVMLLLSACSGAQTEETPGSTPPETTVAKKNTLTLVSEGLTEFEIIRPDEINGAESHLFTSFYKEFNERYGCSIESNSDIMALLKPPAPDAKEILIGNTNREESKLLSQKLTSAGGNRFGIVTTDSRVVINGTDWYQIYLAMDYFFANFTSLDNSGKVTLEIECGFEKISEPSDSAKFDLDQLIKDGKEFVFAASEKVLKFKNEKGAGTPQGGCTDGKYVYVGMMGSADGIDYGVISKYDLATGKLIKVSERLSTFHTNDLTYDSKNNRIVIATLDAGWTRLSLVDADTLEFQGDIITTVGIRGLEYLPETNQYVAAGFSIEIMLLDENFNKISSHICEDQTLMTQGLYSDGKYVYDPRYLEGKAVHLVVVEDMAGNHIASANLYGLSKAEPEHMYKIDGEFYIGCNHSGWLFKVEVLPLNWW